MIFKILKTFKKEPCCYTYLYSVSFIYQVSNKFTQGNIQKFNICTDADSAVVTGSKLVSCNSRHDNFPRMYAKLYFVTNLLLKISLS